MKKIVFLLFSCMLILAIAGYAYLLQAERKTKQLTILYSNTLNNYLEDCHCPSNPNGGLARRATVISDLRKKDKDLLLLDTGDLFGIDRDELKSDYTLKIMEYLKYDAVCIGDQDLVNGKKYFEEKVVKNLPVTVANFSLCENNVCYLIGCPYRIIVRDGIRIGLIGIISGNAFRFYPPEYKNIIKVDDPSETIAHFLKLLKDKADIIILLSHSGFDEDLKTADRSGSDIDVIIGGHSQSLITNKVKINNTVVVQSGRNGEYIGELQLDIDTRTKKVVSFRNTLHQLNPLVKDDVYVRKMIDEYKGQVNLAPLVKKYDKEIAVSLFGTPDCSSCKKVREKIMPDLENKYRFNFKIEYFNLDEEKNMFKLLEMRDKYKNASSEVPVVIIESNMLSGVDEIQKELENKVRSILKNIPQKGR